jgi:hypothetical protein
MPATSCPSARTEEHKVCLPRPSRSGARASSRAASGAGRTASLLRLMRNSCYSVRQPVRCAPQVSREGDDQIHAAADTSGAASRQNDATAARDVTPGRRPNSRKRCACVPRAKIPNCGTLIEPWSLTLEGFVQLAGDLVTPGCQKTIQTYCVDTTAPEIAGAGQKSVAIVVLTPGSSRSTAAGVAKVLLR